MIKQVFLNRYDWKQISSYGVLFEVNDAKEIQCESIYVGALCAIAMLWDVRYDEVDIHCYYVTRSMLL